MIKRVVLSTILVVLILSSCSKFSDKLDSPKLVFPKDGSKAVPVDTTLRWRSANDDVVFEVYLGESRENLKKIEDKISRRFHKPDRLEYEKTYYWKVVAKRVLSLSDYALAVSKDTRKESEIWSFTTEEMPPSTPSNPYPINGATDIPINLSISWNSTDTDPLTFKIMLSDSSPQSLFATTTANEYKLSNLKYETTYYWQIVSDDKRGKIVKGPIWSFTTEEMPPSIPSNPSPSDKATDVSIHTTLSWNSTDTDKLFFTVLLDESSPPKNTLISDASTPSAAVSLKYETTYYWQVISDDKRGKITKGPIWSFTTEEMPPSVPSNPSPSDGEENVSTNVTLSWQSTDTDDLLFTIYLSESSPPTISGTSMKNEYKTNLDYETTYYWQVSADDGRGKITKGPVWSFTTMERPNTPPKKPSAIFPRNGSYGVPVHLTLMWSSTDVDNDRITYDLYFGREKDPPLLKSDIDEGVYNLRLHYSTRYYWKVVAKYEKGGITEGDLWTFRTMPRPNRAPSAPYDPTPEDGKTGVSTNITLRWNAYDPDGDTLRYDIYLGENENPELVESNHIEKFYKPADLENCTSYYWRVDVKDSKGAKRSGPTWRFKTTESSSPDIKWGKTYGGSSDDVANKVIVTKDGYVVVGSVNNSSDYDGKVILISREGVILKEISLGGSSDDVLTDVKEIDDGYILVGYTKSEEIDGYHGGFDFWVLRTDRDFKVSWQRAFGGSSDEKAQAVLIDNGIVVVGYTNSSDGDVSENNGKADGWVLKLDFNGNMLWEKSYGGTENDYINDVEVTSDGNYVMVGYTYSYTKGVNDAWILKTADDGSMNWQKNFGGSSDDKAYSVMEDTNGDYIVAGYTRSSNGDVKNNHGGNDVWILRVNEEGSLTNEKTFGGSNDDRAFDITRSCDGKLLVVGETFSSDGDVSEKEGGYDFWVLRISEGFDLDYEKTFGGTNDDVANSVAVGNGYIVVGYTKSNDGDVSGNNGGKDFWILDLK